MACDCQKYPPPTLDRKAILKRIKESKPLRKRLEVVAEDPQLGIALFRCSVCGETWQSGREWHFANQEYFFRVPTISPEDWKREHYRQPAAMMLYSASMQSYWERAKFTASTDKCRADGCDERASTIGIYCRRHQIEALQKSGLLPPEPEGRFFPPYHKSQNA